MHNQVYCCSECNQVTITTTTPKSEGCARSAFHAWICLGTEGNETYHCDKCKITVHTNKLPVAYGCSVNVFHEWIKIEDEK